MGAGLQWLVGVIRFGPNYTKYGDPYDGHATLHNYGDYHVIGPISGKFTRADHDAILDVCRSVGITHVRMLRNGKWWGYDLTVDPFIRRRID